MLPDFPKLKKRLVKILIHTMEERQSKYSETVSLIPQNRVLEGNKVIIEREDGSIDEMKNYIISSKIEYDLSEIEDIPPEEILKKIDKVSMDIAEQKAKMMYNEIKKTVEKVGNVTDLRGKPFTIDSLIKAYEKVWIDFDKNEKPIFPVLSVGPELYESVVKVFEKLETDPEAKNKFEQLIEKKKAEWRDRENNRKLVG